MTKQVGSGLRHDLGVFEVGAWQDRLQSAEYGVQSASRARERQLGWHAVPTLPEAVEKGDRGAG
jgi:hypothetical protein